MKKNLLKPMLLAFALLAGAVSAWADGGEVWIKTLPKDLQNNDQVVIVDLTKKLAVINNPDEGSAPPAASIKLNDRLDRIAEDAVGDTVKWTVEVQGSGDNRTYKFKTGKKYLTVINKDNGLSVGGDGEKSFKTVQDDGNKRAQFFYTVVKDTTRIMGMYSMMSISNNWRTKMSIDDQIKGTVTAAGESGYTHLMATVNVYPSATVKSEENPAVIYAAARNLLYSEYGKKVEILVNYNPKFTYLAEWWKQLYGESEGKDGVGIFPASVNNTADLHSMGQFIQEGDRVMFETVVHVEKATRSVVIGSDPQNLDQLNYLAGKSVEHCNHMAELGTVIAHQDGGVPQLQVSVEKVDAFNLGSLFYFFEFACGVSAYTLGVNPFNQPGVEAYKKNMFALLEKPGYEEATKAIKARL